MFVQLHRTRRFAGAIAVFVTALAGAGNAQMEPPQVLSGLTTTRGTLLAKAQPDECFVALGVNLPFTRPPCTFSQAKVNQAYIWAMTRSGTDVWFGTAANPQCITHGALGVLDPSVLVPYRTNSWACEFGASPYSPWLLPAFIGDLRPPEILMWNSATSTLYDMTPRQPVTPQNPLGLDSAIALTRGIRAAATFGGMVMLAGPSLFGGLNFFFYDAATREYLGVRNLPGYDNIRQFTVFQGHLYTTVGQTGVGGAVLRWTGAKAPLPCDTCLSFAVVGHLAGAGAYIEPHEGRLFVTTWPTGSLGAVASLVMSPRVPASGLTTAHADGWRVVWDVNDYEPDAPIATTYGGGAMASFDGYLYWGTMHVPWAATAAFVDAYGAPTTEQEWLNAVLGTFRGAAVFRGRGFDAADAPGNHRPNRVDLLYGSPALPMYRPASATGPGEWMLANNRMPPPRRMPLFGYSGFNHPYNNYIWSMEVWDGRLWVGTMDWGHTAAEGTDIIFRELLQRAVPFEVSAFFAAQSFGGDLFFFQSSQTPAVAESTAGVGNFTSYGIRNMLAADDRLFVGMANGSNLLTSPLLPRGGWELIELQRGAAAPLNLLTSFSCRAGGTPSAAIRCRATTSQAAPPEGLVIGVLAFAPGVTPQAPTYVRMNPGENSVTFDVYLGEVAVPTTATLIAGLNGGTRAASATLRPTRAP
jgi:hypothetical protein